MVHQPVIQPAGTADVAEGGQQQKRRGRQHNREHPGNAEHQGQEPAIINKYLRMGTVAMYLPPMDHRYMHLL